MPANTNYSEGSMPTTTFPDDDGGSSRSLEPETWRDPDDATIRHFLGETTGGQLRQRATRRGIDLLWEIDDEAELTRELFLFVQAARGLTALAARRRRLPVYLPVRNGQSWCGATVYFLCTLAPGRYLIESIPRGGEALWAIGDTPVTPARVGL